MKNYFTLFALLFTVGYLQAQITAAIDPNPVHFVEVGGSITNDGVGHSTLTISGADATVNWQMTVVCAPPEWEFAVCDENACWSPSVHSRNEDLQDGVPSRMDVHCYPYNTPGYGEVLVSITHIDNPQEVLTVGRYTFQINTPQDSCSAVTGLDELALNVIDLYPNPVQDQFQIASNDLTDRVLIYNTSGALVQSFTYQNNQAYEVSELASGMYLVALVNEKEGVVKTVRLVKE
jgi:hypothetical protein